MAFLQFPIVGNFGALAPGAILRGSLTCTANMPPGKFTHANDGTLRGMVGASVSTTITNGIVDTVSLYSNDPQFNFNGPLQYQVDFQDVTVNMLPLEGGISSFTFTAPPDTSLVDLTAVGTSTPLPVVGTPSIASTYISDATTVGRAVLTSASQAAARTAIGVGSALVEVVKKTANYTATANQLVPADATSGAITITFPTAPADGSGIIVKKVDSSANAVNLALGGSDVFNIAGGATTGSLQLTNQALQAQYDATHAIWYVTSADAPLSGLDARYVQPTQTVALTNKDLTSGTNTFPTLNQSTTGSAAKWTTARNLAGNSVDGSAAVLFANKFIVQGTADAGLSGPQFLGALGTGLVTNTTTTGVLGSVAAPAGTVVGTTDAQALTNKTVTHSAGTATVAPLVLTSGTNLTTAAAGAVEYDGKAFYATAAASTRQVVDAAQFCTLTSAYTLTSQTAAQKLFNATTNGAVTLPIGTYYFECYFDLSSMSASTGVFGWDLTAGTATISAIKWYSEANKAVLATAAAPQSTVNTAANTSIVSTTTATVGWAKITGKVRISVAGTVTPQVSLGVAAAAVVSADSYFRIWSVGLNTVTNVGSWS